MALTQEQQDKIEAIFRTTVKNAFRRLRDLTLSTHAVNPFLAVLVARRPRELAEFIVHQRAERGLVTSFGMQIQKILLIVADNLHASGVEGADFERVDETARRHTLGQLKSGPETVNSDTASEIRRNLNSAGSRIRSGGLPDDWSVTKMLGMVYGTPAHRSRWVMGLGEQDDFDVDKIGRALWEFASGHEDTYLEVFEIAARVANSSRDDGRTLPEAIQDAVALLTNELHAHYSDADGNIDWTKLVEENM